MRIVNTVLALWAAVAMAVSPFKTHLNTLLPRDPVECTSNNIQKLRVDSCVCPPRADGCKGNPCKACGHDAPKDVTACSTTCTQSEVTCKGCGIFFNSLCRCLRHNYADCITNIPITVGGEAVWALLPGHDNLTTTNKLISGILDLSTKENRAFGDRGWMFAQENYNPKKDALLLNSWRARTHEQVHIHRCAVNETTRDMLSKEDPVRVYHLSQTKGDPDLWCIADRKGGPIMEFASNISLFLTAGYQGVCPQLVGAGILRDKKKRTWACATTNSAGPLGKMGICPPTRVDWHWVSD